MASSGGGRWGQSKKRRFSTLTPKTIRLKLDARALNGLWTSEHWKRELSEPDRICVGITAGTDVIAVSCGWVVLDELQITVLAVDPEQRRRGLGRAVLQKLLVDASNAGVRQAILDVAEDNLAANSLYSSFGFQTIGRRARYYRDGKDALIRSLDVQRKNKLN
jgi:ribosomal-protein-alanine N-acetyltransferase